MTNYDATRQETETEPGGGTPAPGQHFNPELIEHRLDELRERVEENRKDVSEIKKDISEIKTALARIEERMKHTVTKAWILGGVLGGMVIAATLAATVAGIILKYGPG